MSKTEIDTGFAQAVRTELTAIGTKSSRLQRHQRRTRAVAVGIGALALASATTGAAVVVNNLPGTTTVGPVGTIVTTTHTGTGTIDLGVAPSDAGVVVIDLTCINQVGQVLVETTPDADGGARGAGTNCAAVEGKTTHINDGLLPAAGTTSITVKAEPGTIWKATAQYATSTTTPWGVNAKGQTYGIPNGHGVPDLTPARATNGKSGYVFSEEYEALSPPVGHAVKINVYDNDGTTVIGTQEVRTVPSIPVDPQLVPYGVATEGPGQ